MKMLCKRGLPYLKMTFCDKKLNCQPENIITYNVISFFKTLKLGKKPVVVLVRNERSLLGTNLSQLNEKRKWAEKKGG